MLILNAISFYMIAWDKLKAKLGKYRISEKTLLILLALGGIGGLFSMFTFRHKIRKKYFIIVALFGSVLNIFILLQ